MYNMSVISKSVKSKIEKLSEEINKMGVGVEGGGPIEHQTGAFGQVKPNYVKEKNKYLTQHIQNNSGMKSKVNRETGKILGKMEQPSIQGGFGTTGEQKTMKLKNGKLNGYMETDINEEKPVQKASYEFTSSGRSYTDKDVPKTDSFYLPAKIDEEAHTEPEDDEDEETVLSDGRAIKRQGFNTGQLENAQVGSQGI